MTFEEYIEQLIEQRVIDDLDYTCHTMNDGGVSVVVYTKTREFIDVTGEQLSELLDIVINNRKRCEGFRRY